MAGPLVAGCSMSHKPLPLHVNRWDMVPNSTLRQINVSETVSVILQRPYGTEVFIITKKKGRDMKRWSPACDWAGGCVGAGPAACSSLSVDPSSNRVRQKIHSTSKLHLKKSYFLLLLICSYFNLRHMTCTPTCPTVFCFITSAVAMVALTEASKWNVIYDA